MKQDQDLLSIIASHESELTDMERDIAQYFLSSEARQHSLSSSRVTELLHVSKAALTRFSQKCGFLSFDPINNTCKAVSLAIGSLFITLMKKPRIKSKCKIMTN